MVREIPLSVQRSLLSAPALAEQVSKNYSLPTSPTCQFWSRSINDTYLVQAGQTKLMLRISPTGWRPYQHLAAELELLDFLCQQNISVPRPIPQRDGTHILTLPAPEGLRYAAAFTFVPGSSPKTMTTKHSQLFGQAIAQIHLATHDYPVNRPHFQFDLTQILDEPLTRLKPLFVEHPDEFAFLAELSTRLRDVPEHLPRTAPEYGLCHGDVNNSNIHFHNHNAWTIIDFEYTGYGWRVFDIATFINNQVFQLDKTEQTKQMRAAFVEGYQSTRPLSETELNVLSDFVILRQMWLLGTGARFQPNIGLAMFQDWVFGYCLPFMRAWLTEPW